ncbi:hypothetical protein [Burkholderia ambifaria]|uniref:PAAR repeat-containing protein n=1 Tax=Burkholderia ambifaria MEX-5 TaxID=396597 RepID=B1T680_9BURK|nr:hypothetical protein [Burkholderia ambifaria]EDT40921.1 conserved hypothetical protein [Burkholderia ambifaria MEX-5]
MTKKMLALKGNGTTTGGYVLDGSESDLEDGVPYAYHMARASCGNCDQGGPVVGTA